MKKINLKGAITAIVTPFKKNGSFDATSYKKLIDWQIKEGINGIVSCGSTGEAATLDLKEYETVIKTAVEAVKGRVSLIAGAGSNDTKKAIAFSKIAKNAGADALLHVTPFYNKPTPNGLVAHFKAIAYAVDLPIILYNVPGRTGSNVAASVQVRIAREVPQVIATKEASGNLNQMMEIIQNAPEGFVVLSGDDAVTLPLMAVGGVGCISVVANEVPGDFSKMTKAALEGNWNEAKRLHYKLLDLMNINFIESNPIPVKTALSLMGKIKLGLRLPLVPMEEGNKQKLVKVLQGLKLISN